MGDIGVLVRISINRIFRIGKIVEWFCMQCLLWVRRFLSPGAYVDKHRTGLQGKFDKISVD